MQTLLARKTKKQGRSSSDLGTFVNQQLHLQRCMCDHLVVGSTDILGYVALIMVVLDSDFPFLCDTCMRSVLGIQIISIELRRVLHLELLKTLQRQVELLKQSVITR